jgi:hypothetical protein
MPLYGILLNIEKSGLAHCGHNHPIMPQSQFNPKLSKPFGMIRPGIQFNDGQLTSIQ